jgi:DNA-binding Xre family transcriptional regulator
MCVVNVNKLRGRIVEKGMNVGTLAAKLGVDRSTLYRKIQDGKFTIGEAQRICQTLDLSVEDAMAIFFADFVA